MILIFFVKEVVVKRGLSSGTATTKTATTNTQTTKIVSSFSKVLKGNRPFALLLTISGIFSLGAFNYSFVLIKASDLKISKDVMPLIYSIINISHATHIMILKYLRNLSN
jgi:hypothetical protein